MNPYEPPAESVSSKVELPIEVFRSSLPFVILVGLAIELPIHAGMMLLDSELTITIFYLLAFFAVDVIMSCIGLSLAVAYYKIYIYSGRFVGRSFWGKLHDMEWNDVERIRAIGFLGVKYIGVYSRRNTKPVWIPLFLKNLDRFVNLVCQYAEPNNPLVQYFKNAGMVADIGDERAIKGN